MTPLGIHRYTLTSALGNGLNAQLQALQNRRSGLTATRFDACDIACHIGEVAGLASIQLPAHLQPFDCRNHRLAWLALQQDGFIDQVAALRNQLGATRIGVFMGTSTAGIHNTELAFREQRTTGGSLPDWFDYQHTHNLHSVATFVATALQLHGPSMTISTACSSSAKVFAAAARHIDMGWCDAAIVGGVDSLCLTTLYGFNSLQLIASDVCRPADSQRKGISIGEAGGFAIVARDVPGTARHALLGYGESSDAYHMSSPDPQGKGAAAAMQAALTRANRATQDVDYINLHGTGTPANDAAEDAGVFSLFGSQTECSSTKGFTGHTLGAAGIMEAGIALLCLEHGFMPPSLNTREVDPSFKTRILLDTRHAPLKHVLSNSFGFGGSNCSLLFGVGA